MNITSTARDETAEKAWALITEAACMQEAMMECLRRQKVSPPELFPGPDYDLLHFPFTILSPTTLPYHGPWYYPMFLNNQARR